MLALRPPWYLAIAIAAAIALLSWRSGSLSRTGAVAAWLVGSAALSVSWGWGVFLTGWFVLATVLSRVGRGRKVERLAGIVAKGDQRDATQVLANGLVFLLCAIGTAAARIFGSDPAVVSHLTVCAVGALAAAGADTWSTEIGTLVGGTPFSLRTRAPVAIGTSGAVTFAGSMGGLSGAIAIALLAIGLEMLPLRACAPVVGGALCGAWSDTLLGAWLQQRRRCTDCQLDTEQDVHTCGSATVPIGGRAGINNDAVNLLCTIVGACMSLVFTL